ncbi:hypothetical protein J6590_048535, partial [Homalodisca vitripennis]
RVSAEGNCRRRFYSEWEERALGRFFGGKAERAGTNTNLSTDEEVGDTFMEVLMGHNLGLVPENFPERLLVGGGRGAPGRIIDEVLSAEGMCLQFKRCFPERGALVMLCGNDETRVWLRGLAPVLGIGGPGGIGVICGDYRELIRSIKVFFKVDGTIAEKDSVTILRAIGKQNARISVPSTCVEQVHLRPKGGAAAHGGQAPSSQPVAQ